MTNRILIFSLIYLLCTACWSDTNSKVDNETLENLSEEKSHLSETDQQMVVVEDSIDIARLVIDSNAIVELENSKDFTAKGLDVAENAAASAYISLASKSFKAMGNEPFWNIEIKGEELMFHQMGFEKEYYELGSKQVKLDRLVYKIEDSSGKHNIQLELMKAKCKDDMSGQPFAFSVILTKDSQQFKGCAKEIFK